MPQSDQNPVDQLKACLSLSRDLPNHAAANDTFTAFCDHLGSNGAQSREFLELLWGEVLAARRSAAFWQEVCNVEKELSERIAANHVQLRQSYLRLMEEQ
jgi:hypothetical protein